jgi:hypothetical protein
MSTTITFVNFDCELSLGGTLLFAALGLFGGGGGVGCLRVD